MLQIHAAVDTEFAQVNKLIVEQLHSRVPLVENIGHYIVEAGGKRLRPLLVLLAAGSLGAIDRRQISFSAIIEFIHTATLLHDDVVDLSDLRRGRATANAKWGNAPSVLVGDFLYSRAFQMLVQLDNPPLMQLMADTTNTIAEGEVLQLTKAGDPSTTEEAYFSIIECKTAVLFSAAMRGAALLANADASICDSLSDYGLHLGKAFQLADDVLDYLGEPDKMGKNIGDDLAEGKPTLPLIATLRMGAPADQALITHAIKERDPSEIAEITIAVQRCGALEYTMSRARESAELAAMSLLQLGNSPHTEALQQLCLLAIQRDH